MTFMKIFDFIKLVECTRTKSLNKLFSLVTFKPEMNTVQFNLWGNIATVEVLSRDGKNRESSGNLFKLLFRSMT